MFQVVKTKNILFLKVSDRLIELPINSRTFWSWQLRLLGGRRVGTVGRAGDGDGPVSHEWWDKQEPGPGLCSGITPPTSY